MASSADDRVGWVSDPSDGRGTLGILWLCLSTVCLCTYTVLHLDTPYHRLSSRQDVFRTMIFAAVGLMVPEFPAYWALSSYDTARSLLKTWNSRTSQAERDSFHISIRQAQYICARGCRVLVGDRPASVPLLYHDPDSWGNCPECMKKLSEGLPTD